MPASYPIILHGKKLQNEIEKCSQESLQKKDFVPGIGLVFYLARHTDLERLRNNLRELMNFREWRDAIKNFSLEDALRNAIREITTMGTASWPQNPELEEYNFRRAVRHVVLAAYHPTAIALLYKGIPPLTKYIQEYYVQ